MNSNTVRCLLPNYLINDISFFLFLSFKIYNQISKSNPILQIIIFLQIFISLRTIDWANFYPSLVINL